jgi:hypothetical protein
MANEQKKFLVLFLIPIAVMEGWAKADPTEKKAAEEKLRSVEAASDTGHSFCSPSSATPTFRRDLDCRRTDDVVARLRGWERLFLSVNWCR